MNDGHGVVIIWVKISVTIMWLLVRIVIVIMCSRVILLQLRNVLVEKVNQRINKKLLLRDRIIGRVDGLIS